MLKVSVDPVMPYCATHVSGGASMDPASRMRTPAGVISTSSGAMSMSSGTPSTSKLVATVAEFTASCSSGSMVLFRSSWMPWI
ncbi:MAG: hypothetical protein H6734_07770 [Alphaproteobacteria bacterium]|nr:hypothetical protein [Alphaproteobacteria bacterium]